MLTTLCLRFLFLFISVDNELVISPWPTGEFDQIAASVLELPYTGVGVSMFLFLPAQEGPQGFANMVSRLSGNNLRAATHKKNLRKQNVDVKLPKFRMELKISDELIPVSAVIVRMICVCGDLLIVSILSSREQVM